MTATLQQYIDALRDLTAATLVTTGAKVMGIPDAGSGC